MILYIFFILSKFPWTTIFFVVKNCDFKNLFKFSCLDNQMYNHIHKNIQLYLQNWLYHKLFWSYFVHFENFFPIVITCIKLKHELTNRATKTYTAKTNFSYLTLDCKTRLIVVDKLFLFLNGITASYNIRVMFKTITFS